MLFSSMTFLFIFLPLVIFVYFIADNRIKNYVLLVASLIFYSWGEPKYIILMILSIIVNYLLALMIDKFKKKNLKKIILIVSIVFNIGLLFTFKYFDFFARNVNNFFDLKIPFLNLTLPIGISFYTFQILSYVVDVYKGDIKVQKNIFILGTYIALFPQLIAGPIVRYSTIEKQLVKREHSFSKVCDGLRRFLVGFIKKVLIANNVALIADTIFNSNNIANYGAGILLIALLSYTIQIYYDFSGYSDMAIGLGKIFGFDFLENFNYPYSSLSITDFWRRWHISLSSWFRDYVYIPLGGNRCSKIKWIFNILVVWLLTGFWHGASWNFIIWGFYYAVILLIEKLFLHKILDKLPKVIRFIYMFILVNFGWLIFRVENLKKLHIVIKNIFSFKASNYVSFLLEYHSLINNIIFLILGLIFMFPIVKVFKKFENNKIYGIIRDIVLIGLFLISLCSLINNSYNPFIYFRF